METVPASAFRLNLINLVKLIASTDEQQTAVSITLAMLIIISFT
jgi:hypothetical protein